ncbi:MAG: hypothetical protein KDD33_00730 [Bdellovibrionales bacterium]|nr:hypothetical protein [Bdellovibrionales bacterium]
MNQFWATLILASLMACSNSTQLSGDDQNLAAADAAELQANLVQSVTEQVVAPKVQDLSAQTKDLHKAIHQACEAKDRSSQDLQQLWLRAMNTYHYLEAIAFGPLSDNGGELATHIYSWPDKSSGAVVESQIRKFNKKPDTYKLDENRMAGKGLDALEYILFKMLTPEDVLSPDHTLCGYSVLVVDDLLFRVSDFIEQWNKDLNYVQSPVGKANLRPYLAEITQSLFFFDKVLKDRKLAAPFGISNSTGLICEVGVNCQLYLEHPYSLTAEQALRQNIQALSDVINGKAGDPLAFGYSDFFKGINIEKSVYSQSAQLGSMLSDLETLPRGEGFVQKVSEFRVDQCSDGDQLCRVHRAVFKVDEWLKNDFLNALNRDLPGNVQGDND